jgi:hypothetical protein
MQSINDSFSPTYNDEVWTVEEYDTEEECIDP